VVDVQHTEIGVKNIKEVIYKIFKIIRENFLRKTGRKANLRVPFAHATHPATMWLDLRYYLT
jgi:hypothetical protein